MEFQCYVSPKGNDQNDGTKEYPFASMQHALASARACCADACTIFLMEGRHFLPSALYFYPEDSHTHMLACANETVSVMGGISLSQPEWNAVPDMPGVFVCAAPPNLAVDQLFVNDMAQTQARFPKEGKTCEEATIKARARGWANPTGGHLRALHEYGWGGNDYRILGHDEDSATGLSLAWIGDNNRGNAYLADSLIVENILEELDTPAEWYYNNSNGNLYYYPPQEIDLANANITLSTTSEIFVLAGKSPEAPVQDITIEGFSIAQTSRSMFGEKPYISLLRGDWAVVESGAILLQNTKNITIRQMQFRDLGGNGVFFSGYNQDARVTHCDFSQIGSTAIQVVGAAQAVEQPSFWPHAHYPAHAVHETEVARPWVIGPITDAYPRDITIAENHIFDVGIFEKQSAGVNLSVSSRIKILHNTIHHSARSCININDGTFGGHEIAHNDIFDGQTQTMDHGPFNAWGRDRFWSIPAYHGGGEHGEVMRHYQASDGKTYDITQIDAYQTSDIHHNRFHHAADAPHTWGIDLDDGSSNYTIHHNLCLGMGIKLREGFGRTVYNNIVIDGKMEIHVPYHGAKDAVYANLYVSNAPWSYINVDLPRFIATENHYHHNAYDDCGGAISLPQWHLDGTTDEGSVVDASPQFRNPQQNDYTVENAALLAAISFENFAMDDFGQTGCAYAAPFYAKTTPTQRSAKVRRESWNGAFLSEVTYAIESATGSFGLDGVYVETLAESNPAYAIGLRQRDVIKVLGGVPLTDLTSFYNVCIGLHGSVQATIHRTNGLMEVVLQF